MFLIRVLRRESGAGKEVEDDLDLPSSVLVRRLPGDSVPPRFAGLHSVPSHRFLRHRYRDNLSPAGPSLFPWPRGATPPGASLPSTDGAKITDGRVEYEYRYFPFDFLLSVLGVSSFFDLRSPGYLCLGCCVNLSCAILIKY